MSPMTVVVGMALVTLAFRALPLLIRAGAAREHADAPPGEGAAPTAPDWLRAVPLGVLTALIVPGAFVSDGGSPWVAPAAAVTALALAATRRVPLLFVIVCSTGVAVLAQTLG
ncbi:AzlD domain-containing protein [Streptomyces sp. HNM0574]|uniref:AzlD domain-containing protein n=1 Tax=Streptomyces sp. HNM0574 TaxID=2714954 RepID=UPI00146CCCF1|nr:AzlD domain-containing protein [Streptomyces sp. HNM0574]NLU67560.1 hypothetical protein [Streptomyces sp. HNM0574]